MPSFVMRTGNPPLRFIIWLNHWAGKMKGIVRSHWLPKPILRARNFPLCSPKKPLSQVHIIAKKELGQYLFIFDRELKQRRRQTAAKTSLQWSRFHCPYSKSFNLSIGHFRVPKTLSFKVRLGAQPFKWKWVLFAWEWKMISISKTEHLPSFWNRGPGNSEMAYRLGCHLFPSAKLTFSVQWLSQDISLFLHEISLSLEISVHKSLSLFNF